MFKNKSFPRVQTSVKANLNDFQNLEGPSLTTDTDVVKFSWTYTQFYQEKSQIVEKFLLKKFTDADDSQFNCVFPVQK